MPAEEADFFDYLRIYFPNIYDVKYLMKSCKNLKGGLQEVAEQLEVIENVYFISSRSPMNSFTAEKKNKQSIFKNQ